MTVEFPSKERLEAVMGTAYLDATGSVRTKGIKAALQTLLNELPKSNNIMNAGYYYELLAMRDKGAKSNV